LESLGDFGLSKGQLEGFYLICKSFFFNGNFEIKTQIFREGCSLLKTTEHLIQELETTGDNP
jgi:hypothetical protein